VTGYNLGAFELSSSESTQVEASAGIGNLGAGGESSHEASSVANAGKITSCDTEDQRACRSPIRLMLRPIAAGDNPNAIGAELSAANADVSKVNDAIDANKLVAEAGRRLDARDGGACLELLGKALALDPSWAHDDREHATRERYTELRAKCLMATGKCDEGTTSLRALVASKDKDHRKTDADLDGAAREVANEYCPADSANNHFDKLVRTIRDLDVAADGSDGAACRALFDSVDAQWGPTMSQGFASDSYEHHETYPLQSQAESAKKKAAVCIARASRCADGFAYWSKVFPNSSQRDWSDATRPAGLTCTEGRSNKPCYEVVRTSHGLVCKE
jgi:hypothetical protein